MDAVYANPLTKQIFAILVDSYRNLLLFFFFFFFFLNIKHVKFVVNVCGKNVQNWFTCTYLSI